MQQLAIAALLTAFVGCGGATPPPGGGIEIATHPDSPAADGSAEPNLTVGPDGAVYLSWIEPVAEERHALRFAKLDGDAWSPARTIAEGDDWFVNWADFPSLAVGADGVLAAHWLRRSGEGTYAYDVVLSVSRDSGDTWGAPFRAHDDGTESEHGFVSLLAAPDGGFDVVWLDGRETTTGGAMTIRSAAIDRTGVLSDGRRIDDRVCDCCQTDAVRQADGTLLVAFRDRSQEEIRDIAVSRQEGEGWTPAALVHADGWMTPGCPVNGPALATHGDSIACAWFTNPTQEHGRVAVAFSHDGGRSFGPPVRIDEGRPLGRVDVAMLDDGSAVVVWLEGTRILARTVSSAGAPGEAIAIAETAASRASGFPRIVRSGSQLVVAWTETGDPSLVRTAVMTAGS